MPEHKIETVLKQELADFHLSKKDISLLADYLDASDSVGLLAPGVLSNFIRYAQDVGFPSTQAMLLDNLGTPQHKSNVVISVLLNANVLETYKTAGGLMTNLINRTAKEDKQIKDAPSREIKIYDYHPDFVSKVGWVAKKLKLKGEDKMSEIKKAKSVLEDLRKKLGIKEDDEFQDIDLLKHLDDESLEKLSDGLLLALSELEAEGKIQKFKNPTDAKNALLAAIRKLYQSRGLIGKEGRKFQRFGSDRILRKGRKDINKSMHHRHESIQESEDTFTSKVDVNINAGMHHDGLEIDFVTSSLMLTWKVDFEYRSWGIKGFDPLILTKEVEIEYVMTDSEGDEKEGTLTLNLPNDIDLEITKQDNYGIVLYPDSISLEIKGEAKDPSSWKITEATVEFVC